jgi:hypothetical protein
MNPSKLQIASYLAMTQKKDFFVPREALIHHVIAGSRFTASLREAVLKFFV